MDRYLSLPLSTLLLPLSHHPLLRPVHPRLALIESTVLLSPISTLLASVGLSPSLISSLWLVALAGALVRLRHQWRSLVALAGVAEAALRSWNLVARIEEGRGKQKGKSKGRERERGEETRHLLAFWTVYAAMNLASDWQRRAPPSSFPLAFRLPLPLQRLIALLPQLSTPALPRPTSFPQPAPLPSLSRARRALPRPSEPVQAVLKLLLLWTALRTDGTGASALFDWVLGPLRAVSQKRGGGRTRRVVVIEDAKRRSPASEDDDSGEEEDGTDQPTPSSDPFASPASGEDDDDEEAAERTTPEGVTYSLTSIGHPIHGRTARVFGRDPSPSPKSGSGGYVVPSAVEGATDGEAWTTEGVGRRWA